MAEEPAATTTSTTTADAPAVSIEAEPKAAEAPAAAEPVTVAAESTDSEEPQNPLTNKFTADEWTALKEFRKGLPDIFADAYSDNTEKAATAKTEPITLWGVNIEPTRPTSDAKVSVVLMKFLRARNLNGPAARELLVATLRWRDEFDVEGAMKEEHSKEIFGKVGRVSGKDKEGRPVVYNVYGGDTTAVFSDVPRFLRWRVALMEESIALMDFETVDQTVQVHDYAGVSLSDRTPQSKQAASEATSIFSSHYPEMLYRKFFVNVPGYMTWIFWAFKALMPSATFAKLSVAGSGPDTIGQVLLPLIDAKELPEEYGGKA